MKGQIKRYFDSPGFGVVGASADRKNFGNKVLRCYKQHDLLVYPINPHQESIENLKCLKSLNELPDEVISISVITPPNITEKIVDEAIAKGIKNIWMQPGAESRLAIEKAAKNNINVIADGTCILAELGFDEQY